MVSVLNFPRKISLGLLLTLAILLFAALTNGPSILLDIFFAMIYLPLTPLAHLGLPVIEPGSGWGWSGPSNFGFALAIGFWLGAWLLIGHVVEIVLRRLKTPD